MRGRPPIRDIVAAAAVGAALCVHSAVDVAAEAPTEGGTIVVEPSTTGTTVSRGDAGFGASGIGADAQSRTTEPSRTPASGPGPSSAGAVTFRAIPNNALPCGSPGPPQLGTGGAVVVPVCVPASACPAGQTGFYVYDANGAPLGVVCVSDQTGVDVGAPSPSPLQLAQAASARQPWPALRIGVNPGVGLTGLTSWFWLSGNPAMPDATASAGSLSVTVRAMLDGITWDFGDGGTVSSGTDPGGVFPAPSRIQHVYETDTFEGARAVVTAMVRYRVTYSVNGGPFVLLGFKAQPYRASYQVNQLQPQAVRMP